MKNTISRWPLGVNPNLINENSAIGEFNVSIKKSDEIARQQAKKINKHIEIVMLPPNADRNVDRKNVGIGINEKIISNILSEYYSNVSITFIKTAHDLTCLVTRKPDLVFSGVKYFYFNNHKVWLNDYLEKHDIAYICSNKKALDNEYDKSRAKNIMQIAGINTARFFTTEPGEYLTEESIPIAYPLFIKPVTGGDSRGINEDSVVFDFESFQAKVLSIYRDYNSRSLVETYLSGREYSVGIIADNANRDIIAMPIEIIVSKNQNGHRILDYDVKKNDVEKVIAVTNPDIHRQLCGLAIRAFKALGGKSLGRIDIKMDQTGIAYFIEANFMPGLR